MNGFSFPVADVLTMVIVGAGVVYQTGFARAQIARIDRDVEEHKKLFSSLQPLLQKMEMAIAKLDQTLTTVLERGAVADSRLNALQKEIEKLRQWRHGASTWMQMMEDRIYMIDQRKMRTPVPRPEDDEAPEVTP